MTTDRLLFARNLALNKRVIDIGGSRMNPHGTSPFDNQYRALHFAGKSTLVVDIDKSADIVCDLSDADQVRNLKLPEADVILCMETLEHLRNPGVVCDIIAEKVRGGAVAYITLPRSTPFYRHIESRGLGRWWGKCHHLYAFHRHHLDVFLEDNFSGLNVTVHPCLCRYDWKWPLVWLATLGCGLSWGIKIERSK